MFSLGLLGEKQQQILHCAQTFLASEVTEIVTLCVILLVADVAAVACGREFLVSSSQVLLDTMLQLLGDLKPGQCTKLKVYGDNENAAVLCTCMRVRGPGLLQGTQLIWQSL